MKTHELVIEMIKNELRILMETNDSNIMLIYELLEDKYMYFIDSKLACDGELYEYILSMCKHLIEAEVVTISR